MFQYPTALERAGAARGARGEGEDAFVHMPWWVSSSSYAVDRMEPTTARGAIKRKRSQSASRGGST